MAKVHYSFPFETIQGCLNKSSHRGLVQRRKTFRDANGRIIGTAQSETYLVTHPRDYRKLPLEGKQLAAVTNFRQAVLQARQERADPERLRYWEQRFRHQLNHPEPDAPIEPETGLRHIYTRLDLFIIAALLKNR